MKSFFLLATVLATVILSVSGFAPIASTIQTTRTNKVVLNIFDDKERDALTRDSEPDDFFAT